MNGIGCFGLKAYPAYRRSGVEWLEEVPAHWEVVRGKNLWECVDMRSVTGEEELLTVSSERGVLPRATTSVTMFRAASYVGHKLCWPGDLVINSLWAWAGGLGVSQYHGIVSTAYGVYRLRSFCQQDLRYLHKLLRSRPFNFELRVRSKGVWTSRLQLTDTAFLEAPILLPPLDEQVAIVRFLDWVDQRISQLVEAKEKLVELLEELNTSNISQAVTGNFDVRTGQPYPAYKPSDIQWLGVIPSHWDLVPLKRVGRLKSGVGFPISAQGTVRQELLFLKVSDMNLPGNDQWMLNAANTVSSEVAQTLGAQVFRKYTIVFPKVGGALLTNKRRILARDACIDNNLMACVVAAADVVFIYYLLRWLDLGGMAKPGPVPAISEGEVKNMRIPLPSRTEQTAIANYLATSTSKITAAIANTRGEIELLEEFRTRLIADVVTGSVDVREVVDLLEATAA